MTMKIGAQLLLRMLTTVAEKAHNVLDQVVSRPALAGIFRVSVVPGG